MKETDLIIIRDKKSGTYCAWISQFKGLIIQADNMSEIPCELAKSFEVLIKYMIQNDKYQKHEM